MQEWKESDLYEPVCSFLTKEGFTVRAEVKNCDIAAKKGERLIIVELKKAFNLKLVYQAIERQSLSKEVFVAIPRPQKGQNTKPWKSMLKLLKRLELGLLTVALDSGLKTVDVVLEPADSAVWKNRNKIQKLKKEFDNRQFDLNIGGINRKKIVTAYREKAIELACIIEKKETISYQELKEMEKDKNQIHMLQTNVYHWFERVSRGVYQLSEEGKQFLLSKEWQEIKEFYRKKQKETDKN